MVEDGQQLPLQVDPPEDSQKVEPLLGPLHDHRGIGAPLEVCVHVHAQELEAVHPFRTLPIYADGLQIGLPSPEVTYFCLGGVEDQVLVCTPPHQPLDPLPVGHLVASGDESH